MTEEHIQNLTEQEAQASLQSRIEARLWKMGIWFESVHDSITTRPEDAEIVKHIVDSEMDSEMKKFVKTM
jgi:hypothetical protein